MKRSEKEKRHLMEHHFAQSSLDFIFSEIKYVIENDPYVNVYDMFLAALSEMLEQLPESPWPEKAMDFIQKFYLPFEEIKDVRPYMEFFHPYEIYCRITRTYFSLTHWQGKKFFHFLLKNFPAKDEKLVLSTWPDTFLLSQFRPKKIKDTLYFEDIRTQEKYPIENEEKILEINSDPLPERFIALIVPNEKAYDTIEILNCQEFELIRPSFIKNMEKKEWAEFLMQWYCKNLLEQVTELHTPRSTLKFYSAGQLEEESDEHFANRLIEQDRSLNDFPHRQLLVEFFIQVIHAFPRLFDAQVNAIYLLQAVKLLFTDIDFENDIQFQKHPIDFWLYLIVTTLPEEAAQLSYYRL